MTERDTRKHSQKLFGAFWSHLVKGELPNIFDSATARIIIAFLRAAIDILLTAFPDLIKRRNRKKSEPKKLD